MPSQTYTNSVTLTDAAEFQAFNDLYYTASGSASTNATFKSSASPTLGTYTATTSGTTKNLSTSIPNWVKRVTMNWVAGSTNGTVAPRIQCSVAASFVTTGYTSAACDELGTVSSIATNGFQMSITLVSNAAVLRGRAVLELADSATNTWTCTGILVDTNNSKIYTFGGSAAFSGAIDGLRLTMDGTDTFDAGSAMVMYE